MKNIPKIGITGGLAHGDVDNLVQEHKRRAYTADDYIQAVSRAGGVPYIIPVIYNEYQIREQIKILDGVIISGGEDIEPLFYGEEPHRKLDSILPERDFYEKNVLKVAEENNIPVIGICRGNQFINSYYGGTLYQDISLQEGTWIKHSQQLHPDAIRHTVDLEPETWLNSLFGKKVVVNSFHHQAVKKLGDGLKVTAKSRDGVIEGVEKVGKHFCVGLQWHPEMMGECEHMQKLFKEFIKICTKDS